MLGRVVSSLILALVVVTLAAVEPVYAAGPAVPKLAILELKVAGKAIGIDDAVGLSDLFRARATRVLGARVSVISKEKVFEILQAAGREAAKCTGACEIETAREIGAEFVGTGNISVIAKKLVVVVEIKRTRDGVGVAAIDVEVEDLDKMREKVGAAVEEVLVGLLARLDAQKSAEPEPLAAPTAPAKASCPPGQEISGDTDGHCCWPGQAWSGERSACVGAPSACPELFKVDADAETCVEQKCPTGMSRMNEHCCWVGQAWSRAQGKCIGKPSRCPDGTSVAGSECKQNVATPKPVAPPPAVVRTAPPPPKPVKVEPPPEETEVQPFEPPLEETEPGMEAKGEDPGWGGMVWRLGPAVGFLPRQTYYCTGCAEVGGGAYLRAGYNFGGYVSISGDGDMGTSGGFVGVSATAHLLQIFGDFPHWNLGLGAGLGSALPNPGDLVGPYFRLDSVYRFTDSRWTVGGELLFHLIGDGGPIFALVFGFR